jgi:hypothetical protein
LQRIFAIAAWGGLGLAVLSGIVMLLKLGAVPNLTRLGYTGLEIGLAVALLTAGGRLILHGQGAGPSLTHRNREGTEQ